MEHNEFPELGLRPGQRLRKDNDGYLLFTDGQRSLLAVLRNEWLMPHDCFGITLRHYVELVLSALFNVPDEVLEVVADHIREHEADRTHKPTIAYLTALCHAVMKMHQEVGESLQNRKPPKKRVRRIVL
jgi:hypothetical protein